MNPEDVLTAEDLIAYMLEHEDGIFFREKVNDKFEVVAFKDLPSRRKAQRILQFLEDGSIPVRVRHDDEVGYSND